MAQRIYTALDGESVHGPQSILLVDHRLEDPKKKPVTDETALAYYVGATAREGALAGEDPIVTSAKGWVIIEYVGPKHGYNWNPINYRIRRVLHALTLSIYGGESASTANKLIQHYFGRQTIQMPDRVLNNNLEAVRYVIALLLGLTDPVVVPACDQDDMEDVITIALEETLVALRDGQTEQGKEAAAFFQASIAATIS